MEYRSRWALSWTFSHTLYVTRPRKTGKSTTDSRRDTDGTFVQLPKQSGRLAAGAEDLRSALDCSAEPATGPRPASDNAEQLIACMEHFQGFGHLHGSRHLSHGAAFCDLHFSD